MNELHISQFVCFLFFTLLQHLAPKIDLDARKKYELHMYIYFSCLEKLKRHTIYIQSPPKITENKVSLILMLNLWPLGGDRFF